MKRSPSVVMWRGFGILSRLGKVLEAYDDGDYALAKFERYHSRGSRLVLVTARLDPLTRRQCRNEKGGIVK